MQVEDVQAVARTNDKGDWELLGILTFLDPPRPDTRATIEKAYEFGIDVKMITGDQQAIAIETCRVLGMGMNVLTPENLPHGDVGKDKTLGKNYGGFVENADGFAQVYPEHKFSIVEILRQKSYVVGMTGDGVNDAPALKRADIGIAVQVYSSFSSDSLSTSFNDLSVGFNRCCTCSCRYCTDSSWTLYNSDGHSIFP